jgi:hypothetical protein
MRRYREVGEYAMDPQSEGEDARPVARLNIRITLLEYMMIRKLAARLRRVGAGEDGRRLRRGMARILGRETLELIESGRRRGETVEVYLVPRVRREGC